MVITFEKVLAVCGAITLIAAAAKVIIALVMPFTKMKKRREDIERQVKEHAECIGQSQKALSDLEDKLSDLLQVQIVLLNHFIDGNGKEKMKELRDDLIDKLSD